MTTEIIEHDVLVPEIIDDGIDSQAAADIEEARQTYKELLERGKSGLDVAFDIVEGSEHPRAIEVFSTLISSLANINEKLVGLHKAKKELREDVSKENQGEKQVTNNNVFVGSPKDVLELLAQSNE